MARFAYAATALARASPCSMLWRTVRSRMSVSIAVEHLAAAAVSSSSLRYFRTSSRAPARGARAEDARDPRVLHQRERLALALEPREDLARVEAVPHDLERDAPLDRVLLLREVDGAHPALAEARHHAISTAEDAPEQAVLHRAGLPAERRRGGHGCER